MNYLRQKRRINPIGSIFVESIEFVYAMFKLIFNTVL